jgi:hypothetical protein
MKEMIYEWWELNYEEIEDGAFVYGMLSYLSSKSSSYALTSDASYEP